MENEARETGLACWGGGGKWLESYRNPERDGEVQNPNLASWRVRQLVEGLERVEWSVAIFRLERWMWTARRLLSTWKLG